MTESQSLVSVIIPCYNAEKYLAETINSVVNQSYNHIEIIVVDDGSSDASVSIAESISGVQVVKKKNGGVSSARNLGFEASKGEYLTFLDADDWLFPNTIEDKVNALKNSKAGLAHGIVEVTDSQLKGNGTFLKGAEDKTLEALLNYAPPAIPCPSNALIKRDALLKVGLFDLQLSTSADYDLWLRIAMEFEILAVDTMGVKYRQHELNMFSNLGLQIHDMELIFGKYDRQLDLRRVKNKFYNSIAKAFLKQGNLYQAARQFYKLMFL